MVCAYCGKNITEEEMQRETFIWIRECKSGEKKGQLTGIEGGLSILIHRRCFLTPSEEHPCKKGLVE